MLSLIKLIGCKNSLGYKSPSDLYSLQDTFCPLIYNPDLLVTIRESCFVPFKSLVNESDSLATCRDKLTADGVTKNINQLFKYMALIEASTHEDQPSCSNCVDNILHLVFSLLADKYHSFSYFYRLSNFKDFTKISKIFSVAMKRNKDKGMLFDELFTLLEDDSAAHPEKGEDYHDRRAFRLKDRLSSILVQSNKISNPGAKKLSSKSRVALYFLRAIIEVAITSKAELASDIKRHANSLVTATFLLYVPKEFWENNPDALETLESSKRIKDEIRMDHFRYQCFSDFKINNNERFSFISEEKQKNKAASSKQPSRLEAVPGGAKLAAGVKVARDFVYYFSNPKVQSPEDEIKDAIKYVKNRVDDYIDDTDPNFVYYYNLFIFKTENLLYNSLMASTVSYSECEDDKMKKMIEIFNQFFKKDFSDLVFPESKYSSYHQDLERLSLLFGKTISPQLDKTSTLLTVAEALKQIIGSSGIDLEIIQEFGTPKKGSLDHLLIGLAVLIFVFCIQALYIHSRNSLKSE